MGAGELREQRPSTQRGRWRAHCSTTGGKGDDTGPLLEQDLWQALHREGNDQCALHALLGYRTGSVGCSVVRAGTWGHRPGGGNKNPFIMMYDRSRTCTEQQIRR